jgi:prepilin-type processing-associated H-X9-DG protein
MKKFAMLLGVLLVISCAQAQPPDGRGMAENDQTEYGNLLHKTAETRAAFNRLNHPPDKLDLSSPENTVRSFVWAINNQDMSQARMCVADAEPTERLQPLVESMKTYLVFSAFSISDLHSYRHNNYATITLGLVEGRAIDAEFKNISTERLRLKRAEDRWLIHPQQEPQISFWPLPPRPIAEDILDYFAAKMTNAKFLQQEKELWQCQSNLKQIGLGIMQYAQDYEEEFPPLENWQTELLPYVQRNENLFQCAAVKGGKSYSYNPAFRGATLAAVAAPAQTILLYEGKDQKFDFRHEVNGVKFTNILFADGHVKAYSQETLDAAMKDEMVQWKLEQ